jgi:hypothetical protein
LNVFSVYLYVFECTFSIFIFECIYSIIIMYFNVFIIYSNAFIICFNELQCISMCLNVFIDIVIGILPSHSHCNNFAMHTYLHILFTLHNVSFPNMLYYYIIFFPFALIRSNFHTIYDTFHIPCRHWLHGA